MIKCSKEEYWKMPGINHSALREFANPGQGPKYSASTVGDLVHTWCLERGEFATRFHFDKRDLDFRSKEARDERDAVEARTKKKFVRQKESQEAQLLIKAIERREECLRIIEESGETECVATAKLGALDYKCRVDKLIAGKYIVDIKTTIKKSPKEFMNSIVQYGYDSQAALYLDICREELKKDCTFAWLVVSKTSIDAWVQLLPDWAYATGSRWYRDISNLYRMYKERVET